MVGSNSPNRDALYQRNQGCVRKHCAGSTPNLMWDAGVDDGAAGNDVGKRGSVMVVVVVVAVKVMAVAVVMATVCDDCVCMTCTVQLGKRYDLVCIVGLCHIH